MKKYVKDYGLLFLISGTVILLDQWTKYLVRSNLSYGEIWPQGHWIAAYARIIYWTNKGAAFGIFQSLSGVFTVLPIIVAGVILYYFPKVPSQDWPLRLALGLQLGGALGNWIDRMTIGSVLDFVSVGNFAVFNVADASISLGVAILAISLYDRERKEKSSQNQGENDEQTEVTPQPLQEDLKGD